ncbi:MAG: cytochrome c [Tateyamaria sp.]|uniref:c-type cytochrome n=1 Tax=Tateyamaria sp. TaxID=1929288 RepID=UPI00329AE2EE
MNWRIPILVTFCATTALAHSGVKNPAVLARMNGMSAIAQNVKVLGTMAKGQIAFDAATAQEAAAAIARHSEASVTLFAPQETDPHSEARAMIWDNFDDFTDKAQALKVIGDELAGSIRTLEDVQGAIDPLGDACTACHTLYRAKH